ncbi:MAG: DinB family protein [Chitinophagales bacterium]
MTPQLEAAFQEIEADRKQLFARLKNYSNEVLTKKPAPEKWSVAEVIGHLMVAEAASLKYLQKKTQDMSKEPNAGFTGWRRLAFVKVVFLLPIKFKAPEITAPPAEAKSLEALDAEWTKLRQDTYTLISKLSNADAKKSIWKHTLAGKMNIYQMVEFFGFHFKRHHAQIERTLKAVA